MAPRMIADLMTLLRNRPHHLRSGERAPPNEKKRSAHSVTRKNAQNFHRVVGVGAVVKGERNGPMMARAATETAEEKTVGPQSIEAPPDRRGGEQRPDDHY